MLNSQGRLTGLILRKRFFVRQFALYFQPHISVEEEGNCPLNPNSRRAMMKSVDASRNSCEYTPTMKSHSLWENDGDKKRGSGNPSDGFEGQIEPVHLVPFAEFSYYFIL